jgi:hypothetical protein
LSHSSAQPAISIQISSWRLENLIDHGSVCGSGRSSGRLCSGAGSTIGWTAEVIGHFSVELINGLGLWTPGTTGLLASLAFGLASDLALGSAWLAGCGCRLGLLLDGSTLRFALMYMSDHSYASFRWLCLYLRDAIR